MPYYDRGTGIKLYKDDACRNCAVIDICNVHSDLTIDGTDSKYHEVHIVEVGEGKGRDGYVECQSHVEYVPMNERPDPKPGFGQRISEQEAAVRRENPFS